MESMSIIGSADGPTSVFIAGVVNTQELIVIIVAGLILCVFGLKLMKALSAMVGLFVGAGIGSTITSFAGLTGGVSLIIIFGCGILMALLSFFYKKVGAFISVFCYAFGALMIALPRTSIVYVIIAAVVSLILSIVAVIYVEPVVVIVSAVAGGLMAGPAILAVAGVEDKIWVGYLIAIVLAGAGLLLQLLMQSGKIKKKDKIHSQKVKKEASRESDVERARMILDDEDIEIMSDDEL